MAYILDDALGAVGEFKHSYMTVAQFQAQWGPNWVLANGQDITGSSLATIQAANSISNPNNAPNAMALFLRGAGSQTVNSKSLSSTLGAVMHDTTATNGLNASSSDSGHIHSGISSNGNAIQEQPNVGSGSTYTGVVQFGTGNPLQTASGSANIATSLSGDNETAPAHLGVNIFVRIN